MNASAPFPFILRARLLAGAAVLSLFAGGCLWAGRACVQ